MITTLGVDSITDGSLAKLVSVDARLSKYFGSATFGMGVFFCTAGELSAIVGRKRSYSVYIWEDKSHCQRLGGKRGNKIVSVSGFVFLCVCCVSLFVVCVCECVCVCVCVSECVCECV